MRKYLVLEDDAAFIRDNYEPARRDADQDGVSPFTLVYVGTVADAQAKLATERFEGAILDLHLSHMQPEGNKIAIQIHRDYFMPIAIVTGHPGDLDVEIQALTGDNRLVRLFNKNEMVNSVFAFLLGIEKTGLLQIVGPGGEVNQLMADIFWTHLGPAMAQRGGQPLSQLDRKRVLRHAVAHMIASLQSHEAATWDKYLPSEVYIWPAICPLEMTGDIFVELDGGIENSTFWLLVTPSCDISPASAPTELRHLLRIQPFRNFATRDAINPIVKKTAHRYHLLPPAPVFDGGVADFASIRTLTVNDVTTGFRRKGSMIEPFSRELVSRLGTWLARQGTPDFDREPLLAEIRRQWPTGATS
jgi:hypothetical protein